MIQLPIDEMFCPFIVNYVLFDRMTNIYIYIYILLSLMYVSMRHCKYIRTLAISKIESFFGLIDRLHVAWSNRSSKAKSV